MANYGIKVAQKGYDVKTCADYQLAFSSSWPSLKIAASGTFTVPDATQDVVINTHGLGYTPIFFVFITNGTQSTMSTTGTSQFMGINGTNLKWLGATRTAPAGLVTGYYYIFRQQMGGSFTAPINVSTPASPGAINHDYGIKCAKAGKSVYSTDLRDFTIHSGARSPQVHLSGQQAYVAFGGLLNITHNLGYLPMYFCWAQASFFPDNYWQALFSADDAYVVSTTTTLSVGPPAGASGNLAYIILKDPLLLT